MAQDVTINVSLKLIENLNKNFDDINSSLKKMDGFKFANLTGAVTALSAGFLAVTKAAQITYGVLKDVVGVVWDAAEAAAAQEKAEVLLASALNQKGIYTDELLRKNIEYASSMQKLTVYGDEQILQSQTILIQLGVQADKLDEVMKATLDFASATKTDLFTASEIVGKSITTSTNALGRYGIQIDDTASKTDRLGAILDQVGKKFGGSASAEAQSFSGQLMIMKNTWDELIEALGDYLVKNPIVIEAFKGLSKILENVTKFVKENQTLFLDLVKVGVVKLLQGILWLVEAFENLIQILGAFKGTLNPVQKEILKTENDIKTMKKTVDGLKSGPSFFENIFGVKTDNTKILQTANDELDGLEEKLKNLKSQDKTSSIFDSSKKALNELIKKVESSQNLKLAVSAKINTVMDVDTSFLAKLEVGFKKLGSIVNSAEFKDQIFKGFTQSGREGAKAVAGATVSAVAMAFGGPEAAKYAGPIFDLLAKPSEEFKKSMTEFFGFFKELAPLLAENVVTFFDLLVQNIPVLIDALNSAMPMIVEKLSELLATQEFWNNVVQALTASLINGMANPAVWIPVTIALTQAMITMTITWVPLFINALINEIKGGFAWLSDFGKQFMGVVDSFGSAVGVFSGVVGIFEGIAKKIDSGLSKVGLGGGGLGGAITGGLIGGPIGSIIGGLGFAEGVDVPNIAKYKGDNFPAMLNAGEAVLPNTTTQKLNSFLDKVSTGVQTPINVIIQIGENELAKTLVTLNQKGFRLA